MGIRRVRISDEMFQMFLTQGNQYPDEFGRGFCIKQGIPKDAVLVAIHPAQPASHVWELVYTHPLWSDTPKGAPHEVIDVIYVSTPQ